jgi:AraC-like DNA-binding protein
MARKKSAARPPNFESIVTDPSQSFKWHQHDCPSNIARWNYHPEYEIHLITRSHGRQFVGDYIGEFSPGNLVLAGSNLPHNWMSDLQPGEVIEGRDMVVQFAPDLLRADVFPELTDLEPFPTDALRGFEFFGEAARRGASLMGRIGATRAFQRLALFFELIDLLARTPEKKILASSDYAPTLDKETLGVVHDVISYIVNNLSGTVRMSEAAAIAGMMQSTFSRLFKKNTGANFVDYSRKLRIGRACKLLSDTRRSVTDICFEVGYANISNFNRHFRKERGVTPSQYKRLSNLRAAPAALAPRDLQPRALSLAAK